METGEMVEKMSGKCGGKWGNVNGNGGVVTEG